MSVNKQVVSLDHLAILVGSQFYLKEKYLPKQRINHFCLLSILLNTKTGHLVGFSSQKFDIYFWLDIPFFSFLKN